MTLVEHSTSARGSRSVSPRAQILLAALVWTAPGLALPARGLAWARLAYGVSAIAYALPFVALGAGKALLLARAARRAVTRIRRQGRAPALACFPPGAWAFSAVMIGLGLALRASPIPRGVLGLVYVGIGVGLLASSAVFWAALARRRG